MKLWQFDLAVSEMCEAVKSYNSYIHWEEMDEKDILKELLVCILGSGVRYELANAYAEAIVDSGLCFGKEDIDSLNEKLFLLFSSPVYSRVESKSYSRYRYPTRAAKHISMSLKNIINDYQDVRSLLRAGLQPKELREIVVSSCPGIGPKQASHFLKNIGYTEDFAILDRHVVRYLEAASRHDICRSSLSSLRKYEKLEDEFQVVARKFSHSPSIVDQAIWFVMRGIGGEVIT